MQVYSRIRLLVTVMLALVVAITAVDSAVAQKKDKKKPAAYKDEAKPKTPAAKATLPEGKKLSATQLAAHIDTMVNTRLTEEKVTASPRSSDEDFLRRVYLDITGKIPTAEQTVAFLDSKATDKRAKLIDELLASKEFGRHMADIWQGLLLPRNSDNLRTRQWYPNITKWLEDQFNKGETWDVIVRGVLTATGEVDQVGPAVYWIANPTADKATDNVTRMFLGVQLECAQCHNHPFTEIKQDEYWGMAAFFLKVTTNGNPKAAAKNGTAVKISEGNFVAKKKGGLPESAKILPPKFLGAEKPSIKINAPSRPVLADWMTKPGNPFFAKAQVNRVWGTLFGRGIVNPIDDMHEGNVPSHPSMLMDLAQQFTANSFDVKYLYRAICNSETYQRSSKPAGGNEDSTLELWAKMPIKPLTPAQLFDSLQMVAGPVGKGMLAKQKNVVGKGLFNPREQFVAFFSAEDGADATEYQAGIPQVLRLMNGPQLNSPLAIQPIVRNAKNKEEIVENLYLTVLSRRPTEKERERVDNFLKKNDGAREAYSGVFWALLNSSEFALNR